MAQTGQMILLFQSAPPYEGEPQTFVFLGGGRNVSIRAPV